MSPTSGILLIGHGTRSGQGQQEFLTTVAAVRELVGEQPLEAAYLELAQPNIADGVAALAARGVSEIIAAPLMLFAAGHVKSDIPHALADAIRKFPGLSVRQVAPLEYHPALLELSALRHREAIGATDGVDLEGEHTLLLMVSRGSSDPTTVEKLKRFGELRRQRTLVGDVAVGFVAAARPSLSEALAAAAVAGFRRVLIQPHILYHGEVLEEIAAAVARQRIAAPTIDWRLSQHLGPNSLLADALVGRIRGE